MTTKLFRGVNKLVYVGAIGLTYPTVTYANNVDHPEGLQDIVSILNMPTQMHLLATGRNASMKANKSSDSVKFFAGPESGSRQETMEPWTGSIGFGLARDPADSAMYDKCISILKRYGLASNKKVWVESYRWIGEDSPGVHRYELSAGVCTITLNDEQQADAKFVEQTVELMGDGDLVQGYVLKS
jgi:hypothetical protein